MQAELLRILAVIAAGVGLWSAWSALAWKIEKWLFFRSVRHYLEAAEREKPPCG